MWVVYTTYMSKNSIVSEDVIFYLFWYKVIRWSSHIPKKSSFLIIVSWWSLLNETGEVLNEKLNGVKNVIMHVTYFFNV